MLCTVMTASSERAQQLRCTPSACFHVHLFRDSLATALHTLHVAHLHVSFRPANQMPCMTSISHTQNARNSFVHICLRARGANYWAKTSHMLQLEPEIAPRLQKMKGHCTIGLCQCVVPPVCGADRIILLFHLDALLSCLAHLLQGLAALLAERHAAK